MKSGFDVEEEGENFPLRKPWRFQSLQDLFCSTTQLVLLLPLHHMLVLHHVYRDLRVTARPWRKVGHLGFALDGLASSGVAGVGGIV